MELIKVIDQDYLQIYHIKNPSKQWKNKFPRPVVNISYDPNNSLITCRNINNLFEWSIMENYTYIFTTIPEKVIISTFSMFLDEIKLNFDKKQFVKKCGLNGVKQELYTKEDNVIITIMSQQNKIYPPSYMSESVNIISNYNEIINLNKQQFMKAINKIMNKEQQHIKNFIDFVHLIHINFPLNYMLTLRRFPDVIKESDLNKGNENDKNNKKDKTNDELNYYIGYDMRYGDNIEENKLIEKMENICYNDNDIIIIYETYNNTINNIIKTCEKNKINFIRLHDYAISVSYKDYKQIDLISMISDYI